MRFLGAYVCVTQGGCFGSGPHIKQQTFLTAVLALKPAI